MHSQDLELDQSWKAPADTVSFTIMIMQVEPGTAELAVITAIDITEQVQAQAAARSLQREHVRSVSELSTTNKRLRRDEQGISGRQRRVASRQ